MTAILDQEALAQRARNLGAFNGLQQVLVYLPAGPNPAEATLQLYFYNQNQLLAIVTAIQNDAAQAAAIFPIYGGHRILAGPAIGQVKVTAAVQNAGEEFLTLTVKPVGDYSTYTLCVDFAQMDPLLNEIPFKFRPGCFRTDCAPDWSPGQKAAENPTIDYLAKDYDSFRHTLIAAMMARVPGWQPTSEADFSLTLLELLSVAGDELSDFQDRVMNEAYLATCRNRVSLARHARLMDYHIHQGNQAGTVLAVRLQLGQTLNLNKGFLAWTGGPTADAKSQVFMSKQDRLLHYLANDMGLYTWSHAVQGLSAGTTTADLKLSAAGEVPAKTVQNLVRNGNLTQLVVQEWLNPETGQAPGANPAKRQLLRLLPGTAGAEALQDPVTAEWFVRVHWQDQDQLQQDYCFLTQCPGGLVENVCLFHGNVVPVFHGLPQHWEFTEPGSELTQPHQAYYVRTDHWGTWCSLAAAGSLAYLEMPVGQEAIPQSTLQVSVVSGSTQVWQEVINLVHSQDEDEHFSVETDELGRSRIRFGNGVNGRTLPAGAEVHCDFQAGQGRAGNIGQDKLIHFDPTVAQVAACWNPFEVATGRDPEPVAEIIRSVPEAYWAYQDRAVTLDDYVKRAEELPQVSRAAAAYLWTGSWRTVRVAIDPMGTTELSEDLRQQIADHLEAVRLLGEDLEVRPPRFVPVMITVTVCVLPDYWVEDIRFLLEQEFSIGYTRDGRRGFFHPDEWTFGQSLHASQILGRVQGVQGVDHVLTIDMRRWHEAAPGAQEVIDVRAHEIILVENDPDHMELGMITFGVKGGRR